MVLDIKDYLYNTLKAALKTSHLEKKAQCAVRDIDSVGSKFTEAVKKEYGAQFLKDADYIIGFTETIESEPEETKDDNEEVEDKEVKDAEEKEVSKEEKKEEVNESIKVQDLSKSLQVKTISLPKTKKTKKCACVGRPMEVEHDGDEGGDAGEGGAIEEAETTASGADLKKKIIDNIARAYFLDQEREEQKVELYDLPEYIEGKNVYFAKITLKDNPKK